MELADEAIHEHQQDGASGGDADAFKAEAADIANAQDGADVAADDGARDAQKHGQDEAAALFTGEEQLAENACDEAQYDPRKDTHRFGE